MTYCMYSEDGRGDSGGMSIRFSYGKDGVVKQEYDVPPRKGSWMRVGSLYARSYSPQDWWQTNVIKKIIKRTKKEVVFETKSGSIYTWKVL